MVTMPCTRLHYQGDIQKMKLSQKTVQTYRERIYKKLALHTRADLVHYALAYGLLGWENSS